MKNLDEIRNEIDAIDAQIVSLYESRVALTSHVAEYKIANGKDVFDPARELEKLDELERQASDEASGQDIRELFAHIMQMSRDRQYERLAQEDEALLAQGKRGPAVDLHAHTTASDGTFTPTELVEEAVRIGLKAVAITDHDTLAGIPEALKAGERHNMSVIPGIELSTEYAGVEIHVVGLFVDPDSEELHAQAQHFRTERDGRNRKMVELLQKKGYVITVEELYERYPNSVIQRPHMARFLHETGQAKSVNAVFDKDIGDDCDCFVGREMITPMRAVEIIHAAGGLAILAHPCLYKKLSNEKFMNMLDDLKTAGFDGIEVRYSRNTVEQDTEYQEIADRYGILYSGGSDFHGSNKPDVSLGTGTGRLHVPAWYLMKLREHAACR